MLYLVLALLAGFILGSLAKRKIKLNYLLLPTIIAIVFYVGLEVGRNKTIFNFKMLAFSTILSLSTMICSVLLAYPLMKGE